MTERSDNVRRVQNDAAPAPAEWFDGQVEMEPVLANPEKDLRQARVHFHDGATTNWHLHLGDQVLYFVAGKGLAQELGGKIIECEPGDIIHVADGIPHRHGARPGEDAVHIAVTQGETIWDNDPRYDHGRGVGRSE